MTVSHIRMMMYSHSFAWEN